MSKSGISVKLLGTNGNAFEILGKVIGALKRGGRKDLVEAYQKEAMAGDYDHLLQVTMQYVDVN